MVVEAGIRGRAANRRHTSITGKPFDKVILRRIRCVMKSKARVWQPTDLLHPIAPEGGFLPNAWRPSGADGFDPNGFATPVLDLRALAAPVVPESSPPADEVSGTDSQASEQDASDAPTAEASSQAQTPPTPPAPAIDPQALERARAEGHAQGMAQARADMQADVQSETHKILSEDHVLLDKLQATLADL